MPRMPAEVVESHLEQWRLLLRRERAQARKASGPHKIHACLWRARRAAEFECPTQFDRLFAGIVAPVVHGGL